MSPTKKDLRDIVALCCAVARADGTVTALEFEHLVGLLARVAQGAVGFAELQTWLEDGPPLPGKHNLSEATIRLFLHEAIAVARADGKVDEREIATIKALASRCLDVSQ